MANDVVEAEIFPADAAVPVYASPETDTDDGSVTWDLARHCVIGVHDDEDGVLTVFATISHDGTSACGNVSRTATSEQIVDFAVRLIQFATNRSGGH